MKISVVQRQFRRRRRWRSGFQTIMGGMALVGTAPTFANVLWGAITPEPFSPIYDWPVCFAGLVLAVFAWLAAKYLWI